MILQAFSRWTRLVCHNFSRSFILQSTCRPLLIPNVSGNHHHHHHHLDADTTYNNGGAFLDWSEALWFAVPKKKVTRSKKRMKTTAQKRIKLKQNIIEDPRTGETTLRHKLPFNWKDYLPKTD